MALLDFGGDRRTAFHASEKTEKRLRLGFLLPWRVSPTALKHHLDFVKEELRNKRLVFAFVNFARVAEMAVIHGIREHVGDEFAAKQMPVTRKDAALCEKVSEPVERGIAGGIHFKRLSHNGCPFLVDYDPLDAVVVQISERSGAGVFAPADFFAQATLGVFGERINVVFALPEHDREHEFSLRVGFKPEGRKLERLQLPGVEHVDYASAINAIPGEAVGVPCQNSVGLASFDAREHVVENRSARCFGRLFFNELGGNNDMLALGKLTQFVQLRLNGEDLFVLHVGGFSGVKKIRAHSDSWVH